MTDTTPDEGRRRHVSEALARVERESRHVERRVGAVESFCRRVRELAPHPTGPGTGGTRLVTSDAGASTANFLAGSGADSCRPVRRAFAETVRPYSVADVEGDEPLAATMRAELGDELAVALSPHSGAAYTPEVRRAVLAVASARRAELKAMARALETERASLASSLATIDDVAGRVPPDESPPTQRSFDDLRATHDRLTAVRAALERLGRDRQRVLHGRTAYGPNARIEHGDLVAYLYRESPVDYPVLATVATHADECVDRRRAVRRHLARRG